MRELIVGDELDGYEVREVIARGGMATVYRAMDRESGQPVAIKVPHIQYESDVVFYERFRREEEMALQLDHPHVMKALPPHREKSRMYMVLEYVDGAPLSRLLHPGRPLATAQALDIARQVAEALEHLHDHGIFHRDVKPENLLVTPDGKVKLFDLGIAHVVAARRLTLAGLTASMGTPEYMAPEQMGGRVGDERVDVYALGTVLYRMLTGRFPYELEDWDDLLRAKRLRDPTPPTAHVAGLDPALETIVLRAIAPKPADRYGTMSELLADLHDPFAVRPRAPGEAIRAPRHRHDLRRWAAAAAIAVALGGIGWIAHLSHRRIVESAAAMAAPGGAGPAARAQR